MHVSVQMGALPFTVPVPFLQTLGHRMARSRCLLSIVR